MRSYQEMTRRQRIFIEEALNNIYIDQEEEQDRGKPKGKYSEAREIIERKKKNGSNGYNHKSGR